MRTRAGSSASRSICAKTAVRQASATHRCAQRHRARPRRVTTRAGPVRTRRAHREAATLAHSIVLSWGWRRRSIAFVAGALSVLAMAPFNAWPILFFTLPTLVWLIDGIGGRGWSALAAAAAIGWWFGFGYFLAGLYWLGYAFLVDAQTFGWLLPFAVVGLPAGARHLHRARRGRWHGFMAARRTTCCRAWPYSLPLRSGCAAMCSRVFPGTPSVMRSHHLWPWRKRLRCSESGA